MPEELDRLQIGGDPPFVEGVDDDRMGRGVLERLDPRPAELWPHADPVATGQRQLLADGGGEGLVGLEDDLRGAGAGGVHPARQGQAGTADVRDADRVGGGVDRVEDGRHVLHVLEDQVLRVIDVDVALRMPVTHHRDAPVLVRHELHLGHAPTLTHEGGHAPRRCVTPFVGGAVGQ